MQISVVDRSFDLPVSIDKIRSHCRAPENGDDDDLLRTYMKAAMIFLETQTGRVPIVTEFREHFEAWPCASPPLSGWQTQDGRYPAFPPTLKLSRAPIREVYGVSYIDEDGATVDVANGLFRFDRTPEGGNVTFLEDFTSPVVSSLATGPIMVHYVAGYDTDTGSEGESAFDPDVAHNELVGQALLLLTSNFYELREPVNVGNIVTQIPFTLDAILSQLRIFR